MAGVASGWRSVVIDTHAHLDLAAFAEDRAAVLARSRSVGVFPWIVPAISRDHWQGLARLAAQYPDILPAYGLHPVFVTEHAETDIQALSNWLVEHPAIAVGEIGLDGFVEAIRSGPLWDRQLRLFHEQLDVAVAFRLPVILHARKALDLVLKALRSRPDLSGIVHSFSGSRQQAQPLLERGFCLGFGGPITYPRAQRLRRLVTDLPETAFVLETDAPDQPAVLHRGERNEPSWLPEIAATLADLRGVPVETVILQSDANARRVLRLDR